MDKFIVSARKYRPQTFETVVGQEHITTTLKNAIQQNQLAHAFLFCGPRGVGKTTCARILAKTINCENRGADNEACNKCTSCVSFNEGSSLNIHELDAASNNSVDDIRTLVEQVRFAPQAGRYKVYIIDEVHMLSSSAFNAFLKTLEEPPAHAIFILATTEKHKILPTILSRCQIFDFRRITTQDTVAHLENICSKEKISAEKEALQLIAQKSEGCMRDALSILDKIVSFSGGKVSYGQTLDHLNILDEDYYFGLIDCMLQQDLSGAMLLFDDINRKGFEGDMVLNGFAEFLRNLLVSGDEKVARLLDVVESFKERYFATAQKTSPAFIISALNLLNEAEVSYRNARNKRLHVEMLLIRLCYLQQALDLSTEAGDKKKQAESSKSLPFRQIAPFEPKQKKKSTTVSAEPKLIIETPSRSVPVEPVIQQKTASPSVAALETAPAITQTMEMEPPKRKKTDALSKIRGQILKNGGNTTAATSKKPLEQAILQDAWNQFVQQLKDENNSAAQSFELSMLRIIDENRIEVVVQNNLQQKFIEMERNRVCLYLQQLFSNRSLQMLITIEEQAGEQIQVDLPLSARQQYEKMAEQYPLVRELKERLRLELDY